MRGCSKQAVYFYRATLASQPKYKSNIDSALSYDFCQLMTNISVCIAARCSPLCCVELNMQRTVSLAEQPLAAGSVVDQIKAPAQFNQTVSEQLRGRAQLVILCWVCHYNSLLSQLIQKRIIRAALTNVWLSFWAESVIIGARLIRGLRSVSWWLCKGPQEAAVWDK